MTHKHTSDHTTDGAWHTCAAPFDCNPSAHGNILRVEHCACGATRATSINGRHVETGRWLDRHTSYAWVAMRAGRLMDGMYTVSDHAADQITARSLAVPTAAEADAYALCRIETADTMGGDGYPSRRMVGRQVIEIRPR